ncbi:DUF2382 domain-containing protein [uncultured Cellulomonas sp.]|uniref:DUF2382 domain-containing protein n=1 Tax=uncultured Cellulomonas sp. TaxID=189682 RepID=UPI00263173B8|nr:DUF2382 domain-containing protein [uncultured Cellulomonas sp.]
MITTEDIQRLLGTDTPVLAADGSRIGAMGEVFLDTVSGEPAWVTVHTGLLGRAESFVPLIGAVTRGDEIHVPYSKDDVKHAPRPESAGGRLSPDEERALYRHYGLVHDDEVEGADDRGSQARDDSLRVARPVPTPDPIPPRGELAAAGPVPAELTTGAALPAAEARRHEVHEARGDGSVDDDSMVRSEEQLRVVGTEQVPTERVRMRRYTVTEQKEVTVPVRREKVRLEYDPAEPGAEAEVVDVPTEGEPRTRDDRR